MRVRAPGSFIFFYSTTDAFLPPCFSSSSSLSLAIPRFTYFTRLPATAEINRTRMQIYARLALLLLRGQITPLTRCIPALLSSDYIRGFFFHPFFPPKVPTNADRCRINLCKLNDRFVFFFFFYLETHFSRCRLGSSIKQTRGTLCDLISLMISKSFGKLSN